MKKKSSKNTSVTMSYILRHHPEEFNVEVIKKGAWAKTSQILKALNITFEELSDIVEKDKKNRYSFSKENTLIRANQGHSFDVDLELPPVEPPEYLYHGTVQESMHFIKDSGLKKMKRHAVHLSKDIDTATNVASRRKSDNVLLKINSKQMQADGFLFYISENGVWLTENVPYKYIEIT